MWKNFQKALEKRVKKTPRSGLLPDKFMILKTAQNYVLSEYGKEGLRNIKIELSKKEDYLLLRCQRSVWKSEMKLNEEKLVKAINNQFKAIIIKGCFLK